MSGPVVAGNAGGDEILVLRQYRAVAAAQYDADRFRRLRKGEVGIGEKRRQGCGKKGKRKYITERHHLVDFALICVPGEDVQKPSHQKREEDQRDF